MFARVSQARFPPAHREAGLRVIVDDLLPALRRTPGYRGCYLLADGKPGHGFALVLWTSEDAADAAAADHGVRSAHVALAALGLTIESRQMYEVVTRDDVRDEATPACPTTDD